MYRFNAPPSWPLSEGFVPLEGWMPHYTFEPASNGWEFWILEDYDPTLPSNPPDDRRGFNYHPLEIAAKKVEFQFIESKRFLNEAIETAYANRKQKEYYDTSARYYQSEEEKHVEELIRELVHLGEEVRTARNAANIEYSRRQQSLVDARQKNPASSYAPQLIPPQPVTPPTVNSTSSYPQPVAPESRRTQEGTINRPKLTPPPVPVYQKVLKYVGPSVEAQNRHSGSDESPPWGQGLLFSEMNREDKVDAGSLWDTLIQKVDNLSALTLATGKTELIRALEEAKVESQISGSLIKGHRLIDEKPSWDNSNEATAKENKATVSSPSSTSSPEPELIDRRDVSTSHRSQYIEREVESDKEREEKNRFRKEAKSQKEAEEKQRADALEEAKAKTKAEAERIAALKYEQTHLIAALNRAAEIRAHNGDEKADAVVADLKAQLNEIREAMENSNITANNRAGWVYVISNVGSLGEGIVKIGVTRNHDPYVRFKELNGASVPFTFDIHILHFSTDAVGLEAALHRHFSLKKVNLINEKKEFFYTTPEEVKDAMQKLSNGALIRFNLEAPASEWWKSEEIREHRKRD